MLFFWWCCCALSLVRHSWNQPLFIRNTIVQGFCVTRNVRHSFQEQYVFNLQTIGGYLQSCNKSFHCFQNMKLEEIHSLYCPTTPCCYHFCDKWSHYPHKSGRMYPIEEIKVPIDAARKVSLEYGRSYLNRMNPTRCYRVVWKITNSPQS